MRFHGPSASCGPLGGNRSFQDEYDKTYRANRGNVGLVEMLYVAFVPQEG